MSWNLPKLLPKLVPNRPNIMFWVGLGLLNLAITTTAIYLLYINNYIHSNEQIYIIYSVVILVTLFLYGLSVCVFEFKLTYVQNYNKELDNIRNAWKIWSQKSLHISFIHRITPFSPNEVKQLEDNDFNINPYEIYKFSHTSDENTQVELAIDNALPVAVQKLLKPLNNIDFDFLKYSPTDIFFITSEADYNRYMLKYNYSEMVAPINDILSYFEKLEFQIHKSKIIPSSQLHVWLNKTIDNQSSQQALVFFLDNDEKCSETYAWWFIEPDASRTKSFNQFLNPQQLRRPIECKINKINSALTTLSKFQLNPTTISEAWINAGTDEDIISSLSISSKALDFGFSNNHIYNSSKIFGRTHIASVGALVGVLSEKNDQNSLIINICNDAISMFTILPIKN